MLYYTTKLSITFIVVSLATHDRPYFFAAVDRSSNRVCGCEAAIKPIYPESDRNFCHRVVK